MTKYLKSLVALCSIGIVFGKDVFHLVGFDESGTVVIRRWFFQPSDWAEGDTLLNFI